MDSYLVYERRIRVLNEGSTEAGQLRLMPLSSCIEHKTLLRICDYELQRSEREVTEGMWKAYFLSARRSDTKDYARLAAAMKNLAMNTSLSDAESRVARLIADFHLILDTQDMDDFPLEEPKLAVQYLCNSLQPQALKSTIFSELKKTSNKPLKKSVTAFLNWLTPKVQSFCTFEATIGAQQNSVQQGSNAKAGGSGGKPITNSGAAQGGRLRGAAVSYPAAPKSSPPSAAGTASRPTGAAAAGSDPRRKAKPAEERKYFKCGDPSHTVSTVLV